MKYAVRGTNPLKKLRRMIDGANLSRKDDKGKYRVVLSDRKERFFDNQKHLFQGKKCLDDFLDPRASVREPMEFSDCLPVDYHKLPAEVKFGYYMDPRISNSIVNESGHALKADGGESRAARVDFCKQALHHFRSLLRGENFDLTRAIFGANMILRFEGRRQDPDNPDKPSCLPQELCNLAYRLSTAGNRIGVGRDSPYVEKNAVVSRVVPVGRREVGDVLLKKSTTGVTSFRTKPINTKRTRYRVVKKKARGIAATQAKVSAAYQSVYHIASQENDNTKPYILIVSPLFGSTEDGSSIPVKLNDKDDGTVETTLKKTVMAVTISSSLQVNFQGSQVHAAFRLKFAKELKKNFPFRVVTKNQEETFKLEEESSDTASDGGRGGARSLANSKQSLSTRSSSQVNSKERGGESSSSGSTENDAGDPEEFSIFGAQTFPATAAVEEVIVVESKEIVKETKELNLAASKSASGSRVIVDSIAGSDDNGFVAKRAKKTKGEGNVLAKGNIRKSPRPTSDVVFTSEFSVNGKPPLKLQDIRERLKMAVGPLREWYMVDSELVKIPSYSLQDHSEVLAITVSEILSSISNAKSASFENENKRTIHAMEEALKRCGLLLENTHKILSGGASENKQNEVRRVLQNIVKVMDGFSTPSISKTRAKGRVGRYEENFASESTGAEIGSNLPVGRLIELKVSEAALSVRNRWLFAEDVDRDAFLEGLAEILNTSAGAGEVGLTKLEKNHDRLLGLYLAIRRMENEDGLAQLYRNALSVLEEMQAPPTLSQ
jgi:hypothetical protein